MKLKMEADDQDMANPEFWELSNSDFGVIMSDMEELWDKRNDIFDLPNILEFSNCEGFDMNWDSFGDSENKRKVVHHDCMWSGNCTDKFHPSILPAVPQHTSSHDFPPTPPQEVNTVQTPQSGRSLLINAPKQQQQQQQQAQVQKITNAMIRHDSKVMFSSTQQFTSPNRPDTPESLGDEPLQFKHQLDIVACTPNKNNVSHKTMSEYSYVENDDDDEEPDDEDDEDYEDVEYGHHPVYDMRPVNSTIATDHSYTLSKVSKPIRLDLPGAGTPSDSEEEIDVVSLGEKKNVSVGRSPALPVNPSPQARRHLQRTMASAVAERAGLSARPLPQSRKRNRDRSVSPILHHRKKTKTIAKPTPIKNTPPRRRPYSTPNSDSEAENIERRSLHNDMERQRRIGLKNLFDELKMEIPAISQKDRAPKVVILREATSLCKYYAKCEHDVNNLKAKQQSLLARVRNLRLELASSRRTKNA